jgi:hypothetical protein
MRAVLQGRMDVTVIGLGVLALDGKDLDAVVDDESGGDVVLGA